MRDWSSDVCSSDLLWGPPGHEDIQAEPGRIRDRGEIDKSRVPRGEKARERAGEADQIRDDERSKDRENVEKFVLADQAEGKDQNHDQKRDGPVVRGIVDYRRLREGETDRHDGRPDDDRCDDAANLPDQSGVADDPDYSDRKSVV